MINRSYIQWLQQTSWGLANNFPQNWWLPEICLLTQTDLKLAKSLF